MPGEGVVPSGSLAPYVVWHPTSAIPDIETASTERLAMLIADVVRVEGPIVARRAYRLLARASSTGELTQRARRALNRACAAAERRRLVDATDVLNRGGQALRVLRSPGMSDSVARERAERLPDEMPPDEVLTLLDQLSAVDSVNERGSTQAAGARLPRLGGAQALRLRTFSTTALPYSGGAR